MREIRVLSAAESRLHELRRNLATRGITAELGHRLAGFADGEGHFSIVRALKGNYSCSFVIKLRDDDRPVLERYAELTGLGMLRSITPKPTERCVAMPCCRWEVSRKADCLVLLDVFTAYPLWSKKARDFEIWARAVEAWQFIQPTEKADWSVIAQAHDDLRAVRLYPEAPHGDTPHPVTVDRVRGGSA